uniref:Uncharacterized protein n=1 Tax=Avena sativa TaxID=4498 RepID=A0ACD5XZE0_AVESA
MSSINGEEAASSVDAATVAMDTKQVVGTDRGGGGCHDDGCGDGEEEDAVATARSKKPSKEDQSHGGSINPLLLLSARKGASKALNYFLEREDAQIQPMMIITPEFLEFLDREGNLEGKSVASAARDVEEGVDPQPAPPLAAGALLKGVTPDGDTALHVVASNGDGKDFLRYASVIYERDIGLLFVKNHRGDTPLHCAARAGNIEMASHLIDLAGHEGPDRKLALLRMENKHHETALHDAIRTEDGKILGHNDRDASLHADGPPEKRTIVKLLMGADPQLANYPAKGISPLYLAISLEKSTIALTLHGESGGNLSYSGPDGQNALYLAVLRDKTQPKCIKS